MARRGLLGESIATAALAGLLFGFDTAVVAGVTADWRVVFGLDDAALGLTVSAAIWGTLAGALCAGLPGDRYGARNVLRVLAGFYVASAWLRLSRGGWARWWRRASSRDLRSADRRCWRRSISPRSPRPRGADGWSDCSS